MRFDDDDDDDDGDNIEDIEPLKRHGGTERRRDRGTEGRRDGGMEGRRDGQTKRVTEMRKPHLKTILSLSLLSFFLLLLVFPFYSYVSKS